MPEITHVSSIRERAFEPTLADCFVVDGAKLPSMVDYLIQITFETLPYFLKDEPPDPEDKAAREALAAYNDPKPWEFPALAGRVRDLVQASLDNKPEMAEDRQAMATLSEFTILQRLFRLALGGHLGRDFPIEILAELHREVAPAAPTAPVRTLRWDSRPGQLEQALHVLVDGSLATLKGNEGSEAPRLREALRNRGVNGRVRFQGRRAGEAVERDRVVARGSGRVGCRLECVPVVGPRVGISAPEGRGGPGRGLRANGDRE